jgi:hypothetical protein
MQGVTGKVIGVDKTMIAMELPQAALEKLREQPLVMRLLQVIREKGMLQSCLQKVCSLAECDLYTAGKCPPR